MVRSSDRIGSPFCACQIIITAVQIYKLVWAGLVWHFMHACMRRRADMYSIIIIFSYKFKIVNNNKSHQQQEN